MKHILLTGGAGYIGSHVLKSLAEIMPALQVTVVDWNLENSPNREFVKRHAWRSHHLDLSGPEGIHLLKTNPFDVIIHLAALISVEESTQQPTRYWRNNLLSTDRILSEAERGMHLIFASTGTAFQPANAYAYSKVACEEEIIERKTLQQTIFRFYNVSGLREGLQPTGQPTHLIRRAAMAAAGKLDSLTVFGTDWETKDGTCVRDYIHVQDIAESIVMAIVKGPSNTPYECLGSGKGYSVLDVIQSMKRVSGVDFNVRMEGRRDGDVASMICPTQYKHIVLNKDLDAMCLSAFEGIKNGL